MFSKIYKSLEEYEKVVAKAQTALAAENKRIDASYIGSVKAEAEKAARAAHDETVGDAKGIARTVIRETLQTIRDTVNGVAAEPLVSGIADAVTLAQLPGISKTEKEALRAAYSGSYLSARAIAHALGDVTCIDLEEVTADLAETEQILNRCLNTQNPSQDYFFQNVRSGNRLSGVAEEVGNMISHKFFLSSNE